MENPAKRNLFDDDSDDGDYKPGAQATQEEVKPQAPETE
jgi:hypothetical protein